MAIRPFSDQDLADLQCLARAFIKANDLDYKGFARQAAESRVCEDKTRTPEDREKTYNDILKFLEDWNNGILKRAHAIVPCIVRLIAIMSETTRHPRAREIGGLVAALARDPGFRRADCASDFLVWRRDWATKELRKSEDDSATKANAEKQSNNLYKAFARLALDFSTHTSDIALYNDRLGNPVAPKGANGPNGDLSNGGRFVLIRPSSRNENRFVAHGLKMAPHDSFPHDGKFIALYFSEKYRITEGGVEVDRRKSQGICFFDGPFLVAIGRPETNAYFTHIVARIDDREGTLDSFNAIIQTVNLKNDRISAPALCLRCASKEDKHSKIGSFTRRKLVDQYAGPQREALEKWLAEAPRPVLTL